MAKIAFTAGRVAGFKCPAGKTQSFLWDVTAPGLGVRATPTGKPAAADRLLSKLDQELRTLYLSIGLGPDGKNLSAPVVAVGAPGGVETAPGKKWTPEKLAELKSYRDKNGTKKTAEHFGISEQLVRKKLPSEKPPPKGYSVFAHHAK